MNSLNFQDMMAALSKFWGNQGCVIALPYDLEVGAGTMCPETFLRVLGPTPWKVAYLQPSRRPADGRYGENPNRLLKHSQMQVILKPPPADIQDVYLRSLADLGIRLQEHDIRFEEDNWEAPTLGAWGIGWQVMLDGLEITQFTYFQQCGGLDLSPVSVEITYGLERIAAFLQNVSSVYEIAWNNEHTYGEMRLQEELELSLYDFEAADPETCRRLLDLYEGEALRLLDSYRQISLKRGAFGVDLNARPHLVKQNGSPSPGIADFALRSLQRRFPLRKVYELCLKCSHLFNILDARGAISVTERVALIARIRRMAVEVARIYLSRMQPAETAEPVAEVQSA